MRKFLSGLSEISLVIAAFLLLGLLLRLFEGVW